MNSKKLLLACVLSVSAFTHNAYSQESKICSNALQTICTDTKVERAANQKNIEAMYLQPFTEQQMQERQQLLQKTYNNERNAKEIMTFLQ